MSTFLIVLVAVSAWFLLPKDSAPGAKTQLIPVEKDRHPLHLDRRRRH